MAIWQYTVYLLPKVYLRNSQKQGMDVVDEFPGWGIKVADFSGPLSKVFGDEKLQYGIRYFGKSDESDVSIVCDDDTKLLAHEISIRFDLRKSISKEVQTIFDLARQLDALIFTEDFKVIDPGDIEAMKTAIRSSTALRFLNDPEEYLKSLDVK